MEKTNYFKHSYNDPEQSRRLQQLEDNFGLAALGFYWKVREKIHLCRGCYPMSAVMHWKSRGLKSETKIRILTNPEMELFTTDRYGMVRLFAGSPRAGGDIGGNTGGDRGACSGYSPEDIEIEEKNIKENSLKEKSESEDDDGEPTEEKLFLHQMKEHYPRICRLKDPLTFEQYQRLMADGIAVETLADILRQMENYEPLLTKCHSANLTIRNWMRRRREGKG